MPPCVAGLGFVLVVLFSGCVVDVRYPPAGRALVPGPAQALVFGRVRVLEDGVDVTREYCDPWAFSARSDALLDLALATADRRRVCLHAVTENDGAFYWLLPRGRYVLAEVRYGEGFDPALGFVVPDGAACVYVGTLELQATTGPVIHGALAKRRVHVRREVRELAVSVADEGDEERAALARRFAGMPVSCVTQLLVPPATE